MRTIDGRGCFVSGRTKYETKTEVWFFKNILFSDLLDSLKALNISPFGKGYQQSDVLYNLQIYNCEDRTNLAYTTGDRKREELTSGSGIPPRW